MKLETSDNWVVFREPPEVRESVELVRKNGSNAQKKLVLLMCSVSLQRERCDGIEGDGDDGVFVGMYKANIRTDDVTVLVVSLDLECDGLRDDVGDGERVGDVVGAVGVGEVERQATLVDGDKIHSSGGCSRRAAARDEACAGREERRRCCCSERGEEVPAGGRCNCQLRGRAQKHCAKERVRQLRSAWKEREW